MEDLVEIVGEFAGDIVEAVFGWIFGADEDEEEPRPFPETLYEERRPPPDVGTR